MKECSGEKVQKIKVAQNDPDGQQDQGDGVVLHVQEEVYQSTPTFRRRVGSAEFFNFYLMSNDLGGGGWATVASPRSMPCRNVALNI